jgi:hypothetical protein
MFRLFFSPVIFMVLPVNAPVCFEPENVAFSFYEGVLPQGS